jgi:L-amino acid N-acyltransferase YncA
MSLPFYSIQPMHSPPHIRKAQESDKEDIWEIIHQVIKKGDTYVFSPDSTKEEMLQYWYAKDTYTFVAELEGKIAGTFIFKANQPGLGAHVANASFMVHPAMHGKGLGRALGEAALAEAKKAGFQAMQFNIVVSTNTVAKNLWDKLGFTTIGRLPKVFNHSELGLVDAFVMHRFL